MSGTISKGSLEQISTACKYLTSERFDIPLTTYGSNAESSTVAAQYDFRTGEKVNIDFPSANETAAAFAAYVQFLKQYPELDDGMFLPKPVPEDLTMPLGEFAKKYNCTAILNTAFELDPALGNFTTAPTVERIKVLGLSLVEGIASGTLTTLHHNNSELYTKAEAELLSDSSLLLQSEVVATSREDGENGIKLLVSTPQGDTLICAKRLLITIPAKADLLQPFQLSKEETAVFSRFINVGYYTSIVNNTGIPDKMSIFNYDQDTPFHFPVLPGAYNFQASPVPGLFVALYGTDRGQDTFPLTNDLVKADMIDSLQRVQKMNPDVFNQTTPEFVVFSSHTPFYLQVAPEDIADGFYDRLYALQGLRNTYWSSASFRAQDSSDIWRYSEEVVLPQLLAGL